MEDAHAAEYSELKSRCEGIIGRYNAKAQQLVDAMKVRHEEELLDLQNQIYNEGASKPAMEEDGVPDSTQERVAISGIKIKYSKDVLNLRTIQEKLAKQRDYSGAMRVKAKCDALEEKERIRVSRKWLESMRSKEDRLKKKHVRRHSHTDICLSPLSFRNNFISCHLNVPFDRLKLIPFSLLS